MSKALNIVGWLLLALVLLYALSRWLTREPPAVLPPVVRVDTVFVEIIVHDTVYVERIVREWWDAERFLDACPPYADAYERQCKR